MHKEKPIFQARANQICQVAQGILVTLSACHKYTCQHLLSMSTSLSTIAAEYLTGYHCWMNCPFGRPICDLNVRLIKGLLCQNQDDWLEYLHNLDPETWQELIEESRNTKRVLAEMKSESSSVVAETEDEDEVQNAETDKEDEEEKSSNGGDENEHDDEDKDDESDDWW